MRRRLLGAGLALALLAAWLAAPAAWAARGELRFNVVDCTATRSHITGSNAARTALTVQNVGTINVYLGSSGGPATLTAANGFTLHVGSTIAFSAGRGDPTVAVECITDAGESRVQWMEEY